MKSNKTNDISWGHDLLILQDKLQRLFYLGGISYSGLLCFWRSTYPVHISHSVVQPVHSEGDQPWVFFGRNDAKAETPIL